MYKKLELTLSFSLVFSTVMSLNSLTMAQYKVITEPELDDHSQSSGPNADSAVFLVLPPESCLLPLLPV